MFSIIPSFCSPHMLKSAQSKGLRKELERPLSFFWGCFLCEPASTLHLCGVCVSVCVFACVCTCTGLVLRWNCGSCAFVLEAVILEGNGGSCVYSSSLGIHLPESIIHIVQYQGEISGHLSIWQIHPFVSFLFIANYVHIDELSFYEHC